MVVSFSIWYPANRTLFLIGPYKYNIKEAFYISGYRLNLTTPITPNSLLRQSQKDLFPV